MVVTLFSQAYFFYSMPLLIALLLCFLEALVAPWGKAVFGLFETSPNPRCRHHQYLVLIRFLQLDKVSVLFWLLVFNINFGALGMLAQTGMVTVTGGYAQHAFLIPIVSVLSGLLTIVLSNIFQPLLSVSPAYSEPEELSGLIATVIHSDADQGIITASVRDHQHQLHSIPVTAIEYNEQLLPDDKVILIQQSTNGWLVTRIKNRALSLLNQTQPHTR